MRHTGKYRLLGTKAALTVAQTIYGEAGGRYVYPDEWQKGQEAGDLDAISWDHASTLAWHMVWGRFDQIPLPDGFTDQHMYFRQDKGQSPENWDKILRIAGNAFFCYK